jgi:succinyl-diaminopimelate desuccinylase
MKERIFEFIDNSAALAEELERELCKRPALSPGSGGEGELDKCEFLQGWLENQGIKNLERYDAPDSRAKGGVRPNLIATLEGDSEEKRLWIMSHLDVVPPGEASLWEGDPWTLARRDDGPLGTRFIGRGVEDNQQGLASSVLAALALLRGGIRPLHTVKLLFAADEEMGSAFGIDWLLRHHGELFRPGDMALVPDGGDKAGASIEIAEKNLIWTRILTRGIQAHGSRPDLGANAFLAASELALRLHEELSHSFAGEDPLFNPPYSTFEPTKKEANIPNVNTIPGEDVFYMDMRVLPRYPVQAVLAEIDRIKGEVEAKYRVNVSYTFAQKMESRPTPAEAPLVRLLGERIREVYGVEPRPIGIGGGTVAAYLRNQGIDSAVWSRIADSAHQPNEYVLLSSILGDAKVMALMMTAPR